MTTLPPTMIQTAQTNGERVYALLRLNGAAGCSPEWLRARLGVNQNTLGQTIYRFNRERLREVGLKIMAVNKRYLLLSLADARIEREFANLPVSALVAREGVAA